MKTNKYLVGLVLGIVGAVWHVFWSFLVWVGWAQAFIDFIFRLHFITPPYTISAFDFGIAALLVTVVFVLWYILGFFAALVWNLLHGQ
ncbi:MAG: hypothetical protein HYY46_07425 [Deltaproteobacteria bacterium]|nr:hypothetical protein [Deltaproteobacteria bacterium]